jgi:hypothetical protein
MIPPEVGQREHMVRQGFTGKCWSEFLCLGDYLAPPHQVGGCAPRDALGWNPSAADPRRWRRPAGGPVAGAQLSTFHVLTHEMLTMWDVTSHMSHAHYLTTLELRQPGNMPNSVPTNRILSTHAANVRLLRRAMLVGWECLYQSAGP